MNETKNVFRTDAPIWKSAFTYGLIGGGLMIAFTALSNLLGLSKPSGSMGTMILFALFSFVLTAAIYYGVMHFGLKNYRDVDNEGHLRLGRGIGWAAVVSLIIGLMSAIYMYVFMEFIDPSFLADQLDEVRYTYEDMGMDDDQIEQSMSMVNMMMSPLFFGISALLSSMFWGVLAGSIASFVHRTDK